MPIDIIAPSALSAEDIAAWEALQGSDPAFVSPYLSPHWVLAAAAAGGPDAKGARVVVIREGGEAVGFLGVRASRHTARPVGAPMCDYQGLVRRPDLVVCPRAIVRALGVSRLDFTHMLPGIAFTPFAKGRGVSQVIDVSNGYEAYAAEKKDAGAGILKDTAKKRRKLEREHGPVEFVALSDSIEDFEQLIALKRAQYRATRQTDIFDAVWPMTLLRDVFSRRDDNFRGALFALKVKGKAAALHFALINRDVVHCWFIAHDHDFDRYSPGVILIDEIMRWAAARGMRELDLGPGDYRFKFQLANRTREVAHGFVGAPSPNSLMRGAQYAARVAVESLPFGSVSELPGKAMRRLDLIRALRP